MHIEVRHSMATPTPIPSHSAGSVLRPADAVWDQLPVTSAYGTLTPPPQVGSPELLAHTPQQSLPVPGPCLPHPKLRKSPKLS